MSKSFYLMPPSRIARVSPSSQPGNVEDKNLSANIHNGRKERISYSSSYDRPTWTYDRTIPSPSTDLFDGVEC